MNNKFTNLIKDTFMFSLGSLGSKLILFILVPLYTNYLTTAEYGSAELVFTVSQLIIPVASVAIWNGVIRFGLKPDLRPEDVLKNSFLVLITGSILIITSTPLIGLYSPISEWKWYLCVFCIAFITNQIELSYLKVKGQNKLFSTVSVLQTLVLAGLNVLLLTQLRLGISGYLLSNIIANIVAAILIFIVGKLNRDLQYGRFNRDLLKDILYYSAPLIINDVSWWVLYSSNKVMIELLITASALGLYTVAAKIPGLINTFVTIFSQAWGISSIKEIESTNDTHYYSKVFEIYSMLAFGAVICFTTIIKPFMHFYVGSEFVIAWHYVPLLLFAASFSAISTYYGSLFGALQKSIECMWSTLIGAFANIFFNYLLIKQIGVWGAVIGTVIAYSLVAMIRLVWVRKYIYIIIKWRVFFCDIVIAFLQTLAVSLDFHVYTVSFIAIFLFLLNHCYLFKQLKTLKKFTV